jgi:hypothetical protein
MSSATFRLPQSSASPPDSPLPMMPAGDISSRRGRCAGRDLPVWFGAALIVGVPAPHVLWERLAAFLLSMGVIAVSAMLAYAGLHFRKSKET